MVTKLLKKVIPVRPGETTPMLLATSYGFCVLFAFYLLRPVRDEIGAADRGNLQLLWTAVFFVMLLAVPLYSIAVAKLRRGIFVPLANRFFALNLIAFYAALVLLPESARVWIDRVFYVWLSVFALFVVTVFWGLVVDLFREDQGKPRLQWLGYELLRYGARGVTRWTWRRPKGEMADCYVRLGEHLKRRDIGAVADILAAIARQPGFHGVREQSWALCQFARQHGYREELPFLYYVHKVSHGERLVLDPVS